jgi:hypothetical protein
VLISINVTFRLSEYRDNEKKTLIGHNVRISHIYIYWKQKIDDTTEFLLFVLTLTASSAALQATTVASISPV